MSVCYQWDSSCSVNVKQCDAHHQRLFSLINALHEAMLAGKGSQVVDRVVVELENYTKYHFTVHERVAAKAHQAYRPEVLGPPECERSRLRRRAAFAAPCARTIFQMRHVCSSGAEAATENRRGDRSDVRQGDDRTLNRGLTASWNFQEALCRGTASGKL